MTGVRRPSMSLPRLRSFRDMNPYVVGLASVGLIGALVGFAFLVSIFRLFESSYTVTAVFPDAAGMRGGDEVKVAGIKAGRVASLDVDRDRGTVIVTMEVSKGVDLGTGTTAEIALGTLLGSKYIRLAGPVQEPYLADLPADERVIPLERTKTPFDIYMLTNVATRSVEATDTAKLNTFINDLADITEGKQESIARLVNGIDEVATAINSREAELRSLLDRADELTATLAEKDETLVALIDRSRGILRLLADRRDDLAMSLRAGDDAVRELARLITDNEVTIQRLVDELDPTLALLVARQPELNATLAYTGPAQLLQARTGSHGPWVDIFVRSLGPDIIGVLEGELGEGEGAP